MGLSLRPLEDIGLINAAVSARLTYSGGDGELLRDGDECTASGGYAWKPGSPNAWALFSWPDPVTADCVLIYTPPGQSGPIKLILNNKHVVTYDTGTAWKPGESIILHFGETALQTLRMEVTADQQIGEIRVLAKE